ncbi:hypothetical protein FBZ98_1011039 [Rhizobium sp. ERR 922]|uniref:hypothetical protein n=1 Tax=unclassified Rhizobium TaxID=2613769 RepID=UPI0011A63450|nr:MULTISPECIES: hypothetical protein [unclassified Rhizobium]TWB61694.1 hypothetical protein FBZ98_1011039 [Rhizobium sp. ERR 922]TWC04620.1 hypothetical protein FBZ97_1011039 [Rhizobium sp. ERR 942]
MADEPLTDREIYALLDQAHGLFKREKGATEGGQAVIDLFLRNTDLIQRAMLIMLAENRPRSDREP